MIGIEEELGKNVPLDLSFRDESGETVTLRDFAGKPMVLGLVYYTCPGICIPFLDGLAQIVGKTKSVPGEDYSIVTVSFEPKDRPETAMRKKSEIYATISGRALSDDDWHFLTGDSDAIRALTTAVGFRYKAQQDGYLHSSAAIVLSRDGRITRYLTGVDFLPLDVEMALLEAREGRVAPAIAKTLRFCFNYDPEGRRYVFDVLKLGGVIVTGAGLAFLGMLVLIKRPGAEQKRDADRHETKEELQT